MFWSENPDGLAEVWCLGDIPQVIFRGPFAVFVTAWQIALRRDQGFLGPDL
jgi:hypothetical protein